MAEQNIVGNLFGVTPEMYQQAQITQAQNQAMNFAQMTPQQQATYALYSAGQNIPKAVGGLLGIEDPQLQAVRGAQELIGKFDTSSSAGLKDLFTALQQKAVETGNQAYSVMAQQAADRYRKVLESEATVSQKRGENLNTLVGTGKYTPESLGVYARTRNPADLVLIDKGLTGSTLEKVAGAEQNIQNLSSGNTEIDSWLGKVDPKNPKVTFGPMSTLGGGASRLIGSPTDNALEQDKLRRFVAREANAILMAAKGTQTEGDAQRAYDMIMSGLDKNSNEGVYGALEDLKKMKQDTVKGLQTYVETVKGKGKTPTSTATTLQPSATIKAQAAAIRAKNPGLDNYTDEQLVQLALKQSKQPK